MTKFYETMFGLSLDYAFELFKFSKSNLADCGLEFTYSWVGEIQGMDFKLNRVESHLGQE